LQWSPPANNGKGFFDVTNSAELGGETRFFGWVPGSPTSDNDGNPALVYGDGERRSRGRSQTAEVSDADGAPDSFGTWAMAASRS
jgi:hypothetical protein